MRIKVDGLTLEVPPNVYEPSDDSMLLAKYAKGLCGRVLDIGCGCGIQALLNAKHNPENSVLGVDVNRTAVECSRYNARLNEIENAKFSQSDLFEKISGEKFDGIIFNPPYLPTGKHEKIDSELNHAFDGGLDGRIIVDRFLFEFEGHIPEDGTLLMVQSSLNNPEKTVAVLEEKDFTVSVRDRAEFFFEKLYIVEAKRE